MKPRKGKFQVKKRQPIEKIPRNFYLEQLGCDTWQEESSRYNVRFRRPDGVIVTEVHDSKMSARVRAKQMRWIVRTIKKIDWKN